MINIDFVASALEDLLQLKEDSHLTSGMKDQIEILEYELHSLFFYLFCVSKLKASSFGKNKDSGFDEISSVDATLEKKGLLETGVLALDSGEFEDWDNLSSEWLENIQSYKLTIKEDCFNFLDRLFQCGFSSHELEILISCISVYLANFLRLKGDLIADEKVKIESLKKNMDLFEEVSQFTTKLCNGNEEMENFKIHIQAWALNAACFCLLNWVRDEKEENTPTANVNILDLLQKLNTALPAVTWMYLAVLKASKPSEDESLEVATLVSKFVDSLLRKSQLNLPKDDIQMLQNGMIFLIMFLMEMPKAEKHARKLMSSQAAAALNDAASLITTLDAGETKEGIAEKMNFLLHDFLAKVNIIKAEVRQLYASSFLDSSLYNFPRINILGLFDSVKEKLKETSVCYSMHQIETLHKEFVSLRDLLKASNLKEQQDECNELKDLWIRIVNVTYQAQRTISSFMCLKSFVWLDLLCLFDVTEEIKHIVAEVKRIKDHHIHNIDALPTETNLNRGVLLQTIVQRMDEVVVGFEDKAKDILDWLRNGSRELDIISIIGMVGMGKTTLAHKVYSDPSIKYHFTKFAWCTVSQSYNSKKLLLDILHNVTLVDDSFFGKEEEDLADELRKCLKGRKYLIVMDDIWDVGAWKALKLSLPDDKMGSRIIFTSRIHKVVLEAKSDSCPYPLSPLSEEESWELLEKRLFHKYGCPQNFVEVGKQIAKDCKGLPLTIVLVAGILKQKIENLDWWKQIGESLGSRISKEGSAHILELSYRHLPEPLRPCFLYFGSFHEDKEIRVKKLTQLWISEGFIPKQEMKKLETVAEEYLMDLVGRSLVIVTNRSSCGGIKTCRVHDLLWEFCLAKAEEENFFKVLRGNGNSQFSSKAMDKHYRVCIQTEHWRSFHVWNSSVLHSLLFSSANTFNTFDTDYFPFSNPKFLQVLDLEGIRLVGDFPEILTKFVLLRYIAIDCTTTSIPPEILELRNLETLRVKGIRYRFHLPDGIWFMGKLRHVDIGHCIPPYLYDYIPPLVNIQSFSFPCLTCGEKTRRFLRKIQTVQKLRFKFIPRWKDDQILELNFLNYLESLNMTCTPLLNLGSCPFSFPENLKKLTLKGFGIRWTEISTIAKLPNLEVLKLLDKAFIGEAWNMEDEEFLKLKFLKLQALDIEQWHASDEPFPCLEQLVVKSCFGLKEIPSAFGNVTTLEMIRVEWCSSRVARSAKQIQEELIDLGNEDLKVLIGRSSDGE